MPSEVEYADDGVRVYDSAGDLLGHFGYFETLADQIAAFSRPSVAYKQDGSQVAAGVPRYEAAKFGQGVMIEEGTTNLLTANQSSVETDTTGFTVYNGATLTKDTNNYWTGVASLKVVTPGTHANEGATVIVPGSYNPGTALTVSIYVKGTGTIELYISDAQIGNSVPTTLALTGSWQKITSSYTLQGTYPINPFIGILTASQQAITFYVDGLQVEQKPYATSWILGGTTRSPETMIIPTAGVFAKGNWAVELILTPTSAMNAGNISKAVWHCQIDPNNYYLLVIGWGNDIALFVKSGGALYEIDTVVVPVALGGSYAICIAGDGSVIKVFCNGQQCGSASYVEPLGTLPANMYFGSDAFNDSNANGIIDDLRISSCARTLAEHQAYYNSGQPQTVDDATTLLMSMDGTLQPTVRRYGLKVVNGEIVLAGELNAVGPSGDTALSISAQGDQGKIYFYDEGTSKGSIMINATLTRDLWLRGENGLYLDGGPTIAVGNYAGVTNPGIKFGGDITSDFMPYLDAAYSIGRSNRRWLNVRAQYVTSGDICFTETSCPVCGKLFSPDDVVTLLTHTVDPEKIMCLPIHDGCKNSSYEITARFWIRSRGTGSIRMAMSSSTRRPGQKRLSRQPAG